MGDRLRLDRLRVYTTGVIAAGAGALALGLPALWRVDTRWFVALLLAGIPASMYKVSLQLPGGGATMTLGLAAGFASILFIGRDAAMFVVSAGIWAQCTYRTERTTPMDMRRRLFSVACGAITVFLAGTSFAATKAWAGPSSDLLVPLTTAALVYFAVNTLPVAGAVALSSGRPLASVWREGFLWTAPSYFISAGVVGIAAAVSSRYGVAAMVVALIPLVLTYQAYKVYLGRVAEEQRQLRLARDRTQGIIQSMREMLFVVSEDGRITTTNTAASDTLGYGPEELVGQPLDVVLDAEPHGGDSARSIAGPARNAERVLRTRLGEGIPVLLSSSPLTGEGHGATGVVCVALDIRERIRTEAEKRRQVERLRQQESALARLARDPLLHDGDFDASARLITQTAAELLSATRADLWLFDGERLLRCIDSFHAAAAHHGTLPSTDLDTAPGLADALTSERVVPVVRGPSSPQGWMLDRTWDDVVPTSVLHAPIRHGTQTVGVVTLSQARTDRLWSIEEQQCLGSIADLASMALAARNRRAAQEELRRSKEAAEAASLAKSAFVANMSHELRTPLNAIIGYTELMQEEAEDVGDTARLADLGSVHVAARHLLSLVSDVLDFSKIEAGRMDVEVRAFDVEQLVRDVLDTCQPAAAQNRNRLVADIESRDPFCNDPLRTRQVLMNLVGNACKFTTDGEVTVRARQTFEDGTRWLVVDVADTGIGMSPTQVERLFQEFVQADVSTTRRFGGTGLGLAIGQRLARLMKGSIEVSSVEGRGSVFTVRLPNLAMATSHDDEPADASMGRLEAREDPVGAGPALIR